MSRPFRILALLLLILLAAILIWIFRDQIAAWCYDVFGPTLERVIGNRESLTPNDIL